VYDAKCGRLQEGKRGWSNAEGEYEKVFLWTSFMNDPLHEFSVDFVLALSCML